MLLLFVLSKHPQASVLSMRNSPVEALLAHMVPSFGVIICNTQIYLQYPCIPVPTLSI